MLVLGIETSCDETAVAIVGDEGKLLSSIVSSQIEIHKRFGGVVPEIASRNHLEALPNLLDQVLAESGHTLQELEGIAVTARPGLIGALLVGVNAAKSLAWSLGIPFIGIHHLEAHLMAAAIDNSGVTFPHIGLVVSGGHTSLFRVNGIGDISLLGETRDDAAGEAFDKIAKMLDLGYPGGPEIDRRAALGDPKRHTFPQAMKKKNNLEFSFSGLKTAVRVFLKDNPPQNETDINDICAGVQFAITEIITRKVEMALRQEGLTSVVAAGGVVANKGLRASLEAMGKRRGIDIHIPPINMCTDNAAMVAALGQAYLERGEHSSLLLNAAPYRPLGVEGILAAGD